MSSTCPYCKGSLPPYSISCQNCGRMLPTQSPEPPAPKSRLFACGLFFCGIIVGLFLASALPLIPSRQSPVPVEAASRPEPAGTSAAASATRPDAEPANEPVGFLPDGLSLQNVRQYPVRSDWGSVCVVEGQVYNESASAFADVVVEGALYDARGRTLLEKRVNPGTTLNLYQIQTLSQEDRDRKLAGDPDQPAPALLPGQSLPFMLVLDSFPEEAVEFGARVVQAIKTP